MMSVNWKNYIISKSAVLHGKPCIKGTRIPVALIYELIGLNYSINQILEEFPHLTREIIIKILEIGRDANEHL